MPPRRSQTRSISRLTIATLAPAPTPLAPPPDRGPLLYAQDIHAKLRGRKSLWWIRHRFAPEHKLKIGRDVAWYEHDADRWIADQVVSA